MTDVTTPAQTVHGLLQEAAAARGEFDGAVYPDHRLSYGELLDQANRVSRLLVGLGLAPDECVGLMLPASLSQVVMLGAMRFGAVPVPLNGRLKAIELEFLVEHSGMTMLVCDQAAAAIATGAIEGRNCRLVVVDDDLQTETAGDAEEAELARLQQRVTAQDPSMILYTSGTSSKPKGVVHTHYTLVGEGRAVAARLELGPEDRFWSPLPMFHCGGIVTMLGAMAAGAAFCHVGAFEPTVALDQLERERCTLAFPAFETIWLSVLDHPRFGSADLSNLRTVVNVGVRERLRAMQERLPTAIQISSYGLTESCGFMCIGVTSDPLEARLTTSGRPLSGNEVRAIDPGTGEDVPPGEPGEAVFRGVSKFLRYHRDPDATAALMDADGWFRTGDLVSLDEEGRISFQGRLKDMLKVGGENVSAAEVEDLLATHPAVKIVQVVGAPDARYGEVAAAFVELVPGAEVTEPELVNVCLGVISTFKVPRYVRFVSEWPMSGTKIQKFRLRDQIAEELRAAGISEAPRLRSAPDTATATAR
jgi:fatty-acyl-CoA synthase